MDSSAPKYDMRFNPPYQIDQASASSGKRVAATKRLATFRFGFSSRSALDQGLKGTDARGEEHEVKLIWSLTSGKRIVSHNYKEVHFSMGRLGDNKFETSWPIQGGHILKLVAHATPPLRPNPGFKQFELFIDGMSFFELPRIFELGIRTGNAQAVEPSAHKHAFAYSSNQQGVGRLTVQVNRHEEVGRLTGGSSHVAMPRSAEPRRIVQAQPSRPGAVVAPRMSIQDVLSDPAPVSPGHHSRPTTCARDEFVPVQARPPPPTFQDISNQILRAYTPTMAMPATSNCPTQALVPQWSVHTAQTQPLQTYSPQPVMVSQARALVPQRPVHTVQIQPFQPNAPQPAMGSPGVAPGNDSYYSRQGPSTPPQSSMDQTAFQSPVVTPTMTMMTPLEVDELRDSPPPVDAMEKAVQSLVNLNDLTQTKATPEQLKAKKEKEFRKAKEQKSRPNAPVATHWHVGANASLADLKQNKKSIAPAKEVMKVHGFDPVAAQAGMMVVYGQQQPPGGLPPPTGFGSGRGFHHQGFTQPPRRAAY